MKYSPGVNHCRASSEVCLRFTPIGLKVIEGGVLRVGDHVQVLDAPARDLTIPAALSLMATRPNIGERETAMSDLMAVLLNGIAQIEYNRESPLPDHQGAYLDRMDRKMDAGIEVDGRLIDNPDTLQRAQFVAANLAHAIKTNNEELAAATSTYLAVRLQDLQQVKIHEQDGEISIDLVFDEAYVKQYPIQFGKLH